MGASKASELNRQMKVGSVELSATLKSLSRKSRTIANARDSGQKILMNRVVEPTCAMCIQASSKGQDTAGVKEIMSSEREG